MRPSRVLVSLLTRDRADLNLARRKVAHDRLVLVATEQDADQVEAVRASEEQVGAADQVDVVWVDGRDARRLMQELDALFDQYRHADVVLNAAGGTGALHAAILYAAYARGIETWFFQEGRTERLPVLHGLELTDRVTEAERRVVLALSAEGATSRHLAETLIVARSEIEKAFRGLQKKGLVVLDAPGGVTRARPTASGNYVREHLVARRRMGPLTA